LKYFVAFPQGLNYLDGFPRAIGSCFNSYEHVYNIAYYLKYNKYINITRHYIDLARFLKFIIGEINCVKLFFRISAEVGKYIKQGDYLNIEFDLLGKYALKGGKTEITKSFLNANGF